MLIDIFSDTICPWCFIGKRRLERALAERPDMDVTVRWRAFQLNPWMPPEGMDRGDYLQAKFGARDAGQVYENVRRAGASEGIAFRFDRMRRTPNTLDSHRLVRYAAGQGKEDAVVEALFTAYFLEGADIGDRAALAGIAERAGLDAAAARAWLDGGAEAEAVRAEDEGARRIGIQGVPCFILEGRYAISGAQEPGYLLPVLDLVANGEEPARAAG